MGYSVTDEQRRKFRDDGYVHLPNVVSADEVATLAKVYDRFLSGDIAVPGKDLNDMSGDFGRKVEDYSIFNVMLPRKYHAPVRESVFERRAADIARQLHGVPLMLDFDQLLAKRPFKDDAVFVWHQDQQYWPLTEDTRTATVVRA
jgi:phytanoyl-CoA hydroxylase